MNKQLTTTSYSILGLLALRSWTTYELAKQMERTLHYFWPRAESRLYDEPKNLVAQGLAQSEKKYVGKRARTVYTITPTGREALKEWLSTEPSPPSLQCETIVRLIYADHGSKEDLMQAIGTVQREAEAMQRRGAEIAQEYREGRAPFQERGYLNMLMFDFLWRYSEALSGWAKAAHATVGEWPGLAPEGKATTIPDVDVRK
jgi:PadR family transcriptional regulator AphA